MYDIQNPCMACGACCAAFRVSFYWREASDATPGGVPVELAEDFNQRLRVMKGTCQNPVRCAALQGEIGVAVQCAIYDKRPSVCREFSMAWDDRGANPLCDTARAMHGLPAMSPDMPKINSDDHGRPNPLCPAA